MSELKIGTIISLHDSYGTVEVEVGNQKFQVNMNAEELAEVRAIGLHAFQRQQAELAKALAEAKPLALAPPEPYTEFEDITL